MPPHSEVVAVRELTLPTDAQAGAVGRTHVLQAAALAAALDVDGRMTTREERVVREDDVAVLATHDGLVPVEVVQVATHALGGVLHEAGEARHLGRAEREHAADAGGTERQLSVGQHLEAHYAAAKSGLIGLSNVIALEGAPHGISSNTVLPFGVSRMVTETLGDPAALSESGFFQAIRPELVTPLVVYLASRANEVTHHNYSACGGRYARVFTGLAGGWLSPTDGDPTAEDIGSHFAEISGVDPFIVPGSIYEEVFEVCERLGIAG